MTGRAQSIAAAVLILLTAAPPVIHFVFGNAIKAQKQQDDVQAQKDLDNATMAMHQP